MANRRPGLVFLRTGSSSSERARSASSSQVPIARGSEAQPETGSLASLWLGLFLRSHRFLRFPKPVRRAHLWILSTRSGANKGRFEEHVCQLVR